jgi:phenylalanyl-tRNA synthetase beta chain
VLISLRWINEFLTGEGDAPLDAETVSKTLTSLGLEVEGIEAHGSLPGIVVGEVRKVEPHPNADKLRLVTVFDGASELPVVCGAPNVPDPGGKIAFATVGTTMPAGFDIGERKLRGVESKGMICSEDELEIGPDSDGIIILPSDFTPGQALADAVPEIADTVIEISVTPNRPDALGHLGVA